MRSATRELAIVVGVMSLAALGACLGPEVPAASSTSPSPDAAAPDAGSDAAVTEDASTPRQPVTTGPGLMLDITGVTIGPAGVVVASFTITDGAGVPLDLTGTYTEGPVTPKFALAWLGKDGGALPAYTAYTTQTHAASDGGAVTLPDSDTGGQIAEVGVGQGTYTYTFGTTLPATFDPTATHTLGVWAYRDFGSKRYVANAEHDFVPNGAPVTVTRDVVTTTACNQCHNPLGFHEDGMRRRDVKLCVLCHAPPAADATNGNGLDLPTMVHKIHRGRFLPSVDAGVPYELTGDDGGADDHSRTWFPGAVQNCGMCHKGSQGAIWQSEPKRSVCTSCHDRTSFDPSPPTGWTPHGGGVQTDDTRCPSCHVAKGTALAVTDVHQVSFTNPDAPVLAIQIDAVTSTQPGRTPTIHFSITTNGEPLDLLASPLTGLAATVAGPTTDYANAAPTTYAMQGAGAVGALVLDGAVGHYAYTLPAPIPPSATGSFAIGMEGYIADPSNGQVYAALNPVAYVAVTDASPVPRRTVVDRTKCNSCHVDLSAHGGTRKSPEYCVMCHTPSKVAADLAPRFEVASTPVPSENFKVLVHKIHAGDWLTQGYVVGGTPGPTPASPGGTPIDFGAVGFPGDLRACWACHASTSYTLPLPTNLLPTVTQAVLTCADPSLDPATYCTTQTVASTTTMAPTGAACTACHDSVTAVAHANAMTASNGSESCATCHGFGAQYDVQAVHMLPP
jgi:OmcA/MtrC family decaheme c-type cytochrome